MTQVFQFAELLKLILWFFLKEVIIDSTQNQKFHIFYYTYHKLKVFRFLKSRITFKIINIMAY